MTFVLPTSPENLDPGPNTLPIAPGTEDWLLVHSGGVRRVADPASVQRRAEGWARIFPGRAIYAFTSGLENVQRLAADVGPPVTGIFYDYEPNYPNEPEFSFDARITAQNLGRVTSVCRPRGLRSVAYLTGQALLNPAHLWDYASFGALVDEICIQTQASVRQQRLGAALDRIASQFGRSRPIVQVTVAPGLTNAVDTSSAIAACTEMLRRGFGRIVIWWIPGGAAELVTLAGGVRSAA